MIPSIIRVTRSLMYGHQIPRITLLRKCVRLKSEPRSPFTPPLATCLPQTTQASLKSAMLVLPPWKRKRAQNIGNSSSKNGATLPPVSENSAPHRSVAPSGSWDKTKARSCRECPYNSATSRNTTFVDKKPVLALDSTRRGGRARRSPPSHTTFLSHRLEAPSKFCDTSGFARRLRADAGLTADQLTRKSAHRQSS